MTTTFSTSATIAETDADLCAAALAGDRWAFRSIVERYQVLLCSIAYSATGDIGRSEDLAQEAFIIAWKNLNTLTEPAKLKSWLCGIIRNLVNNLRRPEATDVAAQAHEIHVDMPVAHSAEGPVDVAIRREEEALVWQVLSRLPSSYREPLVLYHRSGQSVAEVADQLELREDAVKQRLARGRKLLKAEVAAHVEKLMRASRPGPAFAAAVLAALPAAAPQAVAAGLAALATKSASAKAAATAAPALAGAVLGPLLGMIGAGLGFMAAITGARTPRERRLVFEMIAIVLGLVAGLFAVQAVSFTYFRAAYQTAMFQGVFWSVYTLLLVLVILWGKWRAARIRKQDGGQVATGGSLGDFADVPLRSLNWSLAGAMFGASCWIAVAGIAANDWITMAAAFALIGIVWQRITRWLAANDSLPNRVLAMLYGTLTAFGVDILVSTIRWPAWQTVPGHVAQRFPLWQVNGIIVLVCLGAGLQMSIWYRRACRQNV